VAGQIALSVLLLAGAGLFIQTLRNLGRADPGFDTRNLLQIELDTSGYKPGQVNAVFKILLDLLATIPGVQSVTGIRNPVMTGAASIGFVTMVGDNCGSIRPTLAHSSSKRCAFRCYEGAFSLPKMLGALVSHPWW